MYRSIALSVLGAVALLCGCAKSESERPQAEQRVGELMPAAGAGFDTAYLSDQSQVKLVAARKFSTEPLDTFRSKAAAAKASGGEGAEATDDAGMDEASAESGKAEEDAGTSDKSASAKAPDEKPVKVVLTMPKPEVSTIPENPGKRTGKALEMSRDNAAAAARINLVKAIGAFELNPGLTIADAVEKPAEQMEFKLENTLIIGMKWLDADKLEVELQVSVVDVTNELNALFPDQDFSVLKANESKCFTAKGGGEAKNPEPGARRALPGQRAKDAAEGGGGI